MIPKILLVDDVNMFLDLEKAYLKLASAHLLTARDGAEALTIIRKERPDLVFMDLHMPVMDGAECCRRLKADRELKNIPVVMITTEGKAEEREYCFSAGCDDFLTKPLERVGFLETARRHLPAIDRKDCRVPCRTRVKFKAYGVSLSGEVLDLAVNGMYIAADYDVEPGVVVDVEFVLPGGGKQIRAQGKVAWQNSRQRMNPKLPAGFGVEFLPLDGETKSVLAEFIERQSKPQKKPA